MNRIGVNDLGVVAVPPAAPGGRSEHYFTEMGGMASCPTAGIYAVPVRTGTPVEVVIGPGFGPFPHFDLAPQETLPSFNISKLVGISIAETMVIVGSQLGEYRCP